MDRPIAGNKAIKRKIMWLALPLGLVAALWFGSQWIFSALRPGISRDEIRTGRVDRGPLAATIEASGVLMSESETLITSPIQSSVVRLLLSPGATVKAGDPILVLDTSSEQLELDKLVEQLAIKENAKKQARLDLERNLEEQRGDHQLNSLDLEFLQANLRQKQTLFDQGLVSGDVLRQAQLEVDKKHIQLRRLEETGENAKARATTTIEGLDLEIRVLHTTRQELESRVARATARADRDGVLTWAPMEEGTPVARGEVIARVADLSNFKVKASISDFHASRLSQGLEAEVIINQKKMSGEVIKLLPAVKDGVLEFHVSLPHRDDLNLHANMRADVFVVTARRNNSLRLEKGPAITANGRQDVWVIRNGMAVRTSIETGVSGVEKQEIISGLQEGDEVIISDVRSYAHLDRASVK